MRGLGWLFVVVASPVLAMGQLSDRAPITQPDWPRFLNASMDGVAKLTDAAPPSVADLDWQSRPEVAWSLPLGDGYGLGVVAGGSYFHFDAVAGNERLRKIDLVDGREIWSGFQPLTYRDLYGYEPGPRCSPTIDGERIFTLGVSGQLVARDVATGDILWYVDTNTTFGVVQNFFGVGSSPLVVGDLVLVMVGGSPAEDQAVAPGQLDRVSPNGSLLVAFDKATGKLVWRAGDDLASYSSPRSITLGGRDCVLVFARDHLHLIDAVAGTVLGKVFHRADILESVNAMVPVVRGEDVFISDCYDRGGVLYRVSVLGDVASFEPVWQDPPGNRRAQSLRSHMSTPVLRDGLMFACSGRNAPDSDFRCLDWATGTVRWTALTRQRSTATLMGDVLLILREYGELHVARAVGEQYDELAVWDLSEAADGRPALRFPCWSAPVVVGNQILVRGDETLLCLRIPETR